MNGIIVVDKPQDFTSFDVVAKMRGICQTKKIGHGGTLDPMATGVLPVFIGRAVKAVDLQPRQDKTYEAEILFGIATDTGDVTGEVLEKKDVCIEAEDVRRVLPDFQGEIHQTPPMYSAIKVDGKPLYKYAREGKSVERKSRVITIHSLDYLGGATNRHRIRAHCSKGTYIRTLAEQIGEALGVPATLSALRRTEAGVFSEGQAHSLDEIQQAKQEGTLEQLLLGAEVVFEELPELLLPPKGREKLLNGAFLKLEQVSPGRYRAWDAAGFVGLVHVAGDGTLRAEKILCDRE